MKRFAKYTAIAWVMLFVVCCVVTMPTAVPKAMQMQHELQMAKLGYVQIVQDGVAVWIRFEMQEQDMSP